MGRETDPFAQLRVPPSSLELFRKQELQRRALRRKALLLNEEALLDELLTPEEAEANRRAILALQRGQAEYEKTVRGGYWKRLWNALWGR